MKTILNLTAAALVALTAACGPSEAEKAARLEGAAAAIDSIVGSTQAPFESVSATYAAPNVDVAVTLRDSMIKVDLLGEQLMDYYAADGLKSLDAQQVWDISKTLKSLDTPVVMTITDTYGAQKTFIFPAEKIQKLLKAKPTSLDVPKVKEQVVAMAGGAVPAPLAHPGTQVSASIEKGFLTYTVVWPSKKNLAGVTQGNLTGNYLDALRRQYGRLGDLEYPVVEMLKSLGIDGVRMVYTAADDDDVQIKQAFPWREIFK